MKINKEFALRTVMNQKIVIAEGNNADNFGKILKLNDSAAMLWDELFGKTFELEDAAALLEKKFGIDHAQALEDAACFINRMTEKGIIEK